MSVRIITGAVFALFIGLIAVHFLNGLSWIIYPAVLLGVIILGCFLFAPFRYTLTDDSILVNRPIGGLRIPLNAIQEIRRIEKREFATVIRALGVGGLFGYFGQFDSSSIGPFRAYVTDMNHLVLLTGSQSQKTILSPSNPDDFIQTVLQAKSAG